MGHVFDNTARRGLRAIALALSLAGCLGLASAQAQTQAQTPALSVGSHVQPSDAPREFLASRSLAAAVSLTPARVELGAWKDVKASSAPLGGAMQVGAQRLSASTATTEALAAQLHWQPSPTGGWVAAVSVRSEGAYGIRLGVEVDQLPGSAMLRVYAQDDRAGAYEIAGQRVLQALQANLQAGDDSADGRTWWTPDSGGDEVTLEIELPAGTAPQLLRLAIPRVMHVHENLSLPLESENQFTAQLNESMACHLDSTCYDEYSTQRNAVARMFFVQNGLGYVCTGTLINDRSSSGTPYFLTANHCIGSQTVASTLETSWFYRTPSCNSRTLSSANRTLRSGATLLYATATYDAALLKLNEAAPAGAVFAGWTTAQQAPGVSVTGIHHPRGDLQKISFGKLDAAVDCAPSSDGMMTCYNRSGNYYMVTWSQGRTEQGSSGSGLFIGGQLAGTLYGNDGESCQPANSISVYGRFDMLYPNIEKWLGSTSNDARTAVFRFFNTQTGAHFYTANAAERDYVIATYPAFQYENVAFYAFPRAQQGLNPVFRFFNAATGAHFFTINLAESNYVRANYPTFNYEGPSWYAQAAAGNGSIPMFRFFNQQTGAHFYTTNAAERDFVINHYPVFKYENVAYHVWNSQ